VLTIGEKKIKNRIRDLSEDGALLKVDRADYDGLTSRDRHP